MRKLGTIDLEVLNLAIKGKGTFNENNLENSELKRHGVGKILDTLASLKDRKFISLNNDGSFSITELARDILWSSNIPIWGKILRLLQIKSCNLNQIIEVIQSSEEKIMYEIEELRKNQLILMSPQRQEDKLIKIYEILPEGVQEIDKTETQGFNKNKFKKVKPRQEISEMLDVVIKEINVLKITQDEKEKIVNKIFNIKDKLEV
tara:strand:- start:153 stop:767 length:615 start_codon:yes stop_codon:yes gene_type:complete